jgi:catechol 2,3-dioxygenase-like lactoylglutathione lyase family enzyme
MRIHHIALRTRDVARLERFYVAVLGLPVAARHGEKSVWLDADGVFVMLEQAADDEPGVVMQTKELVAFGIESTELAACLGRLASAGVGVEARTEYTHYFRDPDGRRVAISHYPHAPRV